MNNYRTIQQKTMQLLFPAWEQNIPSPGTKHSQPGNKTGLRFAVTLLLMLVLGVNIAWAQETDYSGVYYIGSNGYKAGNTSTNFYLCPTEGWCYYQATNDFTGTDNGQPFLTTYTCRDGEYDFRKAGWIIKKHSSENYYYIIQAETGKYLMANGQIRTSGNADRMRVHLEKVNDTNNLDDKALFDLHLYSGHLVISSKSSVGWNVNNKWLTVNNGNYKNLVGNSGKTGGPTGYENVAGIICIYTENDARADFYLEKAAVDKPTITNNTAENTFTITAETGANIYYTTDGSEPTKTKYTGTGTTSVNVNLTGDMTVIKAIAKAESDYFPSLVESYEIPVCERPVITVSGGTVTITCATEGATIYYTTDGSNPATSTSSNSSFSPVSFPQGEIETIRAIATSPGYVKSAEAQLLPPTIVHSSSEILNDLGGNYILADDFTLSGSIGTSDNPFTGTIDGNMITRTFSYPLVAYADGATIKNVILKDVTISGDIGGDDEMENVGAICNEARGASRIYNCGVLGTLTETKDEYGNVTKIESTSSITGSGNVGSIVGLLDGTSRVINCYSYATVSGGTMAAGIVGNNAQASTQSNLKTIVVNCMFYGDISGNGSKYPVYGNNSINNDSDTGINPYCYFRKNATFSPTAYNRSWPAEEKNLTRFEYYRSVLNSNRKLCTWWVSGTNGTAPTDNDVIDVGIAKWVLDPSIAPYPILKTWGKYPSVINQNPDKRVDPSTKTWVNRDNASANWGKDMAPDTEGQILGTVTVTINGGSHHSGTKHPTGSTSKSINITAMDTEYNDYCYGKIQLPYYNEIFGDPEGDSWAAKYGGNYTAHVVTGWDISGGSDAVDYNFADRNSYNGRIFAQGGYFYVPKGVTEITITAHWADAVYLANRGYSIDRVNVTNGGYRKADKTEAKNFAPAGTVSNTFQNNTVYDDLQTAISALGSSTVYNQAIVLIGNHQVKNGSESVAGSANNWHPFTIMSADFDFDNEPDFCLQLQFRAGVDRPGIQPIRFDFLPVIELGLAVRHDNMAYAIGIMVPQGHFEITETAFMRTTQFEWDTNKSGSTGKTRMDNNSPVILNGGEFEQLAVRYGNGNRTSYFLLGGNLWFHRFAPGSHPNKGNDNNPTIRLCPVNVIGGDFPEFYLSGLYRPDKDPYSDQGDPKCYINGGHFGTIHGSGYDKIAGSVTFKIDHAVISEFYGGGINGSNPIGGVIDVTINNSRVDKYCGGPEVGDMTGKTVTTNATGTTFGVFYGGGNGGNSYYRQLQHDGDKNSNHIETWTDDGYNWNGFTPLGVKDDNVNAENKGYHAEYEFEVFNQSNGVTDEITQRGFIKWIQFGITKTGNVSNKLSNCKILNNFYGGGNLATVAGTVTSELTNTIVEGSVFGGGYSAAIPTFQVHDKSTAEFPSITAGVITDGHIDYDSKVYEWTNEPDTEEHDADYMKAHPTYQKNGKWYCYTWNSLDDLGAVTGNVSLTIDGNTTLTDGKVMKVNESVYGGGEESNVEGNTQVNIIGGTITENVFGGGKGEADEFSCSKAMVGVNNAGAGADLTTEENKNKGTKVTISNGTVNGNVYGGGEVGRVEWNTQVTIGAGEGTPIINGSVFGAGAGVATHGYAALVRGNSSVTIQGNAKVIENVYGGGEQATVGRYWVKGINNVDSEGNPIPSAPSAPTDMPDEMPYKTMSGGQGSAQVGPDDGATATAGHVFGAGKGVTPHYVHTGDKANWSKRMVDYNSEKHTGEPGTTWDYYADDHNYVWEYFATEDKYFEFLQTLALVTGADVTIDGGGTVKGNVYGGSESGFVQDDTDVKVTSGTIGTSGTTTNGNVFGGGKGLLAFAEAGKVKGTTKVAINNGAIKGNVYGGGELGDVGLITKPADYNYTWKQSDGNTDNTGGNNDITDTNNNTGICTVTISGGTIGISESVSSEHGNVFGAGKGAGTTFWCEKAIAFATNVSVNGGTVHGNVYGGGQIGRVEDDAKVTIGGASAESGADIKGSVFGAGAGLATHGYSALVRGNTIVTVDGYAKVAKSVYGGGETASVGRYGLNAQKMPNILVGGGKCELKVQGNATIGEDVFGACKGVTPAYNNTQGDDNRSKRMVTYDPDREVNPHVGGTQDSFWNYYDDDHRFVWEYFTTSEAYSQYLETLALATHPEVTIDGSATVGGSVYGGGELGLTKGSVIVNIQGGTIEEDVYGGGALADTNTTELVADNYPTTSPTLNEDGSIKTKQVHPTTTVNLTGGLIKGDAYGGGLGSADAPAYVHGDVLVDLNGTTTKDANTGKPTTTGTPLSNSANGCVVSQIFGCNNVNGSPKGNVMVHIYATQNKQTTTIGQKFIREIDSDTAKGENETDPAYVTRLKGILTGKIAFAEAFNITVSDEVKALCTAESPAVTDLKTAITSVTTSINVKTTEQINSVRYDMEAVYGGGNMAAYVPDSPFDGTSGSKTQVIVEGCDATSIETVYGGGNAAAVPETNVTINAAYEIGYVFGGGNGKDDIAPGVTNPGADVGQYKNGTETVTYGTGNANSTLIGGLIHEAYGGSNTRGVIKGSLNQTTDPGDPKDPNCCELIMDKVVGAGKYADIDGDVNMTLSCQPNRKINELFAGADEANVNGNITLNITNGHFGKVFGGNNLGGAVKGKITVNVEETECQPIKIDNLYLGGNQAAYSVYGYYESEDIHPVTGKKILKPRVSATDTRKPVKHDGTEYASISDFTNYAQPELNIISCTYIGNVFGGGLGKEAKMYANPTVNVNMVAGGHEATAVPAMMAELELDVSKTAANPDNLGIIRNIYGGGDAADIEGNTTVNIAVEYVVKQVTEGANVTSYYTRSGAGTTADPFVYTAATGTADEETTYYEKKDVQGAAYIIGSVFGGGNAADVLGNTNVTMSGGYVFNGIFGGGYAGNVGTFTRSSALEHTEVYGHTAHASKCIGKPISCKEGTGKCTVLVNGGQIGPISVATEGMNRPEAQGGPVPQGWVWGGGQGLIEDPAKHPDTHFLSYVGSTDVTIGGTALVMESIIGGGEFGRVLGNTKVTITGQCQIGVGANQTETIGGVLKPKRYTDDQFVNPLTTTITSGENCNALAECSHFPYGEDTNEDGIKDTFLPYDPYYDKYKAINSSIATSDLAPASTASPSDGKTWIGCVFAGGSGYMPYEKEDGSGYDWCSSAGLVEGNTEL